MWKVVACMAFFLQLTTQVKQYEQLGPDFETLTFNIHKVSDDLRHAEYTLQQLQSESP